MNKHVLSLLLSMSLAAVFSTQAMADERKFIKKTEPTSKHTLNKQKPPFVSKAETSATQSKHGFIYSRPTLSWQGNSQQHHGFLANDGVNTHYQGVYDPYYHNNHQHHDQNQQRKRLYKRLHKQNKRIQRGVRNGRLVHSEANALWREQRYLKETLAYYTRDGLIDRYELARMHTLLDISQNNIQEKLNNRLTRYSNEFDNYANDHYNGFIPYNEYTSMGDFAQF